MSVTGAHLLKCVVYDVGVIRLPRYFRRRSCIYAPVFVVIFITCSSISLCIRTTNKSICSIKLFHCWWSWILSLGRTLGRLIPFVFNTISLVGMKNLLSVFSVV